MRRHLRSSAVRDSRCSAILLLLAWDPRVRIRISSLSNTIPTKTHTPVHERMKEEDDDSRRLSYL